MESSEILAYTPIGTRGVAPAVPVAARAADEAIERQEIRAELRRNIDRKLLWRGCGEFTSRLASFARPGPSLTQNKRQAGVRYAPACRVRSELRNRCAAPLGQCGCRRSPRSAER